MSSESTKRRIKGAYALTKLECDQLIKKSNVPYTILRPAITYGAGSRGLFKKTLDYIEKLPFVPVVGDARQKLKPIHVGDVTSSILACLETQKAVGREYDLTGPDKLEFNDFIDQILEELNIKRKKIHLPFSLVYSLIKFFLSLLKILLSLRTTYWGSSRKWI